MGYHPRIRVDQNTRCMKVTQYSFDPHPSLGSILRVIGKIDGYPVGIEVPLELFRKLALAKRGIKDRRRTWDFTYQDGLNVGRYLLDKWVLVRDAQVREVFES